MLNKEQIIAIINKAPKKLKHKLTGNYINEYNYTLEEQLGLIRVFIYDKTGKDVGEIKPPKGEMCPSFIQKAIEHSVSPVTAMGNGSDLIAADFAMNVALKYFKNKYDETRN